MTIIIPNPDFADEVESSDDAEKARAEVAAMIAAEIVRMEPVVTGEQKATAAATVSADGTHVLIADPIWNIIEYGSHNNPPYRPISKACLALGLTRGPAE